MQGKRFEQPEARSFLGVPIVYCFVYVKKKKKNENLLFWAGISSIFTLVSVIPALSDAKEL